MKPNGFLAVIYNERKKDSPFLKEYEAVLVDNLGTKYSNVNHSNVVTSETLTTIFGGSHYSEKAWTNQQRFDWEGLMTRVSSSSYFPAPSSTGYTELVDKLKDLFTKHKDEANKVTFEYESKIYFGNVL